MARQIRDRTRQLTAALLDEARIPERYRYATVQAVKNAPLSRWLQSKMEFPGEWLGEGFGFYLHGAFNGGKSSAAALLGMDAIMRVEKVLWLPVADVPRVRFREDDEAKKIDLRLRTCDLLILDDLGAERFRLTTAAGTALEETVRAVYDRNRSVVISSNIKWERLSATYGQDLPGFLSVLERIVTPVEVQGDWPKNPPGAAVAVR